MISINRIRWMMQTSFVAELALPLFSFALLSWLVSPEPTSGAITLFVIIWSLSFFLFTVYIAMDVVFSHFIEGQEVTRHLFVGFQAMWLGLMIIGFCTVVPNQTAANIVRFGAIPAVFIVGILLPHEACKRGYIKLTPGFW